MWANHMLLSTGPLRFDSSYHKLINQVRRKWKQMEKYHDSHIPCLSLLRKNTIFWYMTRNESIH